MQIYTVFGSDFDANAHQDLGKRETARMMVESALRDRTAIISFQVIQEFLNVATRKFAVPLTEADSALYLKKVLNPLCEVHSSIDLYQDALDIQERCVWTMDLSSRLSLDAKLLRSGKFNLSVPSFGIWRSSG